MSHPTWIAEARLVETSNVTTGVRMVQHDDDAGERRIALVYRMGVDVEVHRFIAPEYQIRDEPSCHDGRCEQGVTAEGSENSAAYS